jgi:hypothetical protein
MIRLCLYFCFHDSTVLVDLGLLIVEVSSSHSKSPNLVGLLWTSGRIVAENSTWKQQQTQETDIYNAGGFEPSNSASELRLTHALDFAATGTLGPCIYNYRTHYILSHNNTYSLGDIIPLCQLIISNTNHTDTISEHYTFVYYSFLTLCSVCSIRPSSVRGYNT